MRADGARNGAGEREPPRHTKPFRPCGTVLRLGWKARIIIVRGYCPPAGSNHARSWIAGRPTAGPAVLADALLAVAEA